MHERCPMGFSVIQPEACVADLQPEGGRSGTQAIRPVAYPREEWGARTPTFERFPLAPKILHENFTSLFHFRFHCSAQNTTE